MTVIRARSEAEIAACLALRAEVFLIEQQVPEPLELDGLDGAATHLLALSEDIPVGTLRLRQIDRIAKIERVCVAKPHRRQGWADALTRAALTEIAGWRGIDRIQLSAQTAVIPFYERHGFIATGPIYDDAGIPHRDMIRPADTPQQPGLRA